MALKDLLIHIDNSRACEQRLDVAIRIAQRHMAHLTGLYAMPHFDVPIYAKVPHAARQALEETRQGLLESANAARAMFDAAMDSAGVVAEWRYIEGEVTAALNGSARYVDLVILGQHDPDDATDTTRGLADRIVLEAGRPCLVIPYIGAQDTLGQRVLVAWNARREAVRAVNDALPILQGAENVSVLAVDPPVGEAGEGAIPCVDICHHLARHGVHAEARSTPGADIEVGNILLSLAADLGIDLIVMGAYGHSRLRETVLGGVTRHMLHHMTVPIFMSH
jgi:nucleotide-binding universal stress UspA family protein